MQNIIQETNTNNLHLSPSHIRLSGSDLELAQALDNRGERMKRALEPISSQYDHILIDTPPSLGLLTINSLTAADQLLIPVSTGYFAMTGLVQLQETIEMVKQTSLNPDIEIIGLLCTFSETTNVSQDVEQELREHFGNLVFKITIPKNVRLEEAHSRHSHIFDYSPNCKGALAYKALVKEVLSR